MKRFKTIDVWTSIVLMVVFAIYSLIKLDNSFLIGYCIVGGWQMISMVIHAFNGWFTFGKAGRYYYHLTVAVLGVVVLLSMLAYPVLWVLMAILLVAAPFMAVYYTLALLRRSVCKNATPDGSLKIEKVNQVAYKIQEML